MPGTVRFAVTRVLALLSPTRSLSITYARHRARTTARTPNTDAFSAPHRRRPPITATRRDHAARVISAKQTRVIFRERRRTVTPRRWRAARGVGAAACAIAAELAARASTADELVVEAPTALLQVQAAYALAWSQRGTKLAA